jgi:hypothetical protein
MAGRAIIRWSWAGIALYAVVAIPSAAGVEAFDAPSLAVALLLFFVSLGIWVYAFLVALSRSAAGDDIVVANLFLAQGPVPRAVRWNLFGSVAASCAVAAVAAVGGDPFGVLVPMWSVGFLGLWGARHGEFPPRRDRIAP